MIRCRTGWSNTPFSILCSCGLQRVAPRIIPVWKSTEWTKSHRLFILSRSTMIKCGESHRLSWNYCLSNYKGRRQKKHWSYKIIFRFVGEKWKVKIKGFNSVSGRLFSLFSTDVILFSFFITERQTILAFYLIPYFTFDSFFFLWCSFAAVELPITQIGLKSTMLLVCQIPAALNTVTTVVWTILEHGGLQ